MKQKKKTKQKFSKNDIRAGFMGEVEHGDILPQVS